MPAAANMVLNNAAAVAKTFTLLQPSAGLNSNAEWALQEGAIVGVFPRITSQVRVNTSGKSRVSQHKLIVPQAIVDSTTSTTQVGARFECNLTVTVPDAFPTASRADAAAYLKNYVANAIAQAIIQDAIPAT
jgi:hypothetical protein